MTTPAEYREFAFDCLRWADEAHDAGQRDTLIGLGRVWMQTAIVVEQYVTLAGDDPMRAKELRSKLN
jgi:hypothetical protein